MAKLCHIQQCIKEIDEKTIYKVPVINGAAKALVSERQLRNKYETNREIKYWSTFFLLKALTTSGDIQNWRSQRQLILSWLQMNEPTFYNQLKILKEKKLLTVDKAFNITLISNRDACTILDIEYTGITLLPYNPCQNEGKQIFQYFLRAEELRSKQEDQLEGLAYHLNKNPLLRNDLHWLLVHQGANPDKLVTDKKYLQERLLKLQLNYFRHGSKILEYAFSRRADINRSVNRIKEDHCYKSARSVSYMKMRMKKLKLILVEKICTISKERERIYVPDASKKNGVRDGYKWLRKAKETAWFLCDQISITYLPIKTYSNDRKIEKKAA